MAIRTDPPHPARRTPRLAVGLSLAISLVAGAALATLLAPPVPAPGSGAAPSSAPSQPPPAAVPARLPVEHLGDRPVLSALPSPLPRPQARLVPVVTPAPSAPSRPTTPSAPAPSGLPACRYDDLPVFHAGLGDWRITLLDTIYALPSSYAPGDLVDSSAAGLNGGYPIRRIVLDDLRAMVAAARAAGAPLGVVSGYRSYAQQVSTFNYWVRVSGRQEALRTSARPGHSEHQLGTTLDFKSAGGGAPWNYRDWATTAAGSWMAHNAWRYGFVLSYPKGATARTCYSYESWHYRYVGRDLAARIAGSGRTAREVLWQLQ
jgi:D-alanyl-D-alanine carboxypeptidase